MESAMPLVREPQRSRSTAVVRDKSFILFFFVSCRINIFPKDIARIFRHSYPEPIAV